MKDNTEINDVNRLSFFDTHDILMPTRSSRCEIPLTVIHQPVEEMCAYAVDAIIRQAAGEVIPVRTVLPVRLVERCST